MLRPVAPPAAVVVVASPGWVGGPVRLAQAARSVPRPQWSAARGTARPVRYEGRSAWALGRRDLELTRLSLARLGCDAGTDVVHPLLAPEFLAICASGVSPEGAGRPGGRR